MRFSGRVVLLFTLLYVVVTPRFIYAEESSNSSDSVDSVKIQRVDKFQEIKREKKDIIASRTAELRVLKEDFMKKREEMRLEFKEKLKGIKDERKKTVLSNIGDKIENRNDLWVKHWNEVIKRLTSLVTKIETRTAEAAKNGKEVSSINSAILEAKNAIAAAQVAVDAQSLKTYSIDVSSEENLRVSASGTISTFQTDVKNVVALLNTARRAVQNVFQQIKTVVGSDE